MERDNMPRHNYDDNLEDNQVEKSYLHFNKTDNSNIVVESLEDAAKKHANNYYFENDFSSVQHTNYTDLHKGTISDFKTGANWQKEQYKDLVQSHAELLDILKTAKQELWENEKGWNRIDNAIEKAEKINIQ